MAKANNAFAVAKGLVQCHTEGDANVFISVMVVNFKIAFGLDVQVKQTVGGDLVEHVVEEGDASIGNTLAGTIHIKGDAHIGFFGGAGDGGGASGEFEVLHGVFGVGAALWLP